MAQGNLKLKAKARAATGKKQKSAQPAKAKSPKKGGRVIAPKKAKVVESQKLKKRLEVAIRGQIEEELSVKASARKSRGKPVATKASQGGQSQAKPGKSAPKRGRPAAKTKSA